MADGNGDAHLISPRWLRTIWARARRGPFTGRDAVRALVWEGWTPKADAPNPASTYCHDAKPGQVVAIDPDLSEIWEGDVVFLVLCRQMGISSKRLLHLLERSSRGPA